ncbi:MAG: PilN domain-containing protein [Thiothrix sp.]|nr:PilN domain-containing protein [Thiothrix sp.]HPQ95560.1 PilN domain-containing protein [Thiolinea sp.]
MLLHKLKHFFNWWSEGLLRGLPSPLRQLFRAEQPRLSLQLFPDNSLKIYWRQDSKLLDRGHYRLSDTGFDFGRIAKKCAKNRRYLLELLLDRNQALHLQHSFPESVQENIRQVVGYQIDRLTPFAADAAYFDARVTRHERSRKEVLADIFVAPRQLVDRLKEQLGAAGIPAFDLVSVLDTNARLLTRQDSLQMVPTQRWSRIPLLFFLGALILALAVPMAYKYRRVGQVENAIAKVRSESSSQLEVREKLLAAEDALHFLQERRQRSPVTLDIVERLSNEIPRHTWLERLELEGDNLQIYGESEKALTLIDTLEDSSAFSKVSFKSPVTRSRESGMDKFHIQAHLETGHD